MGPLGRKKGQISSGNMPVFLTDQPKSKIIQRQWGKRYQRVPDFRQETDPLCFKLPSLLQMISFQQDTKPKSLPLSLNPVNTHPTTHGTPPSNGAQAHTLSRKCHLSPPLARACHQLVLKGSSSKASGLGGASSGTQDLWHHGPPSQWQSSMPALLKHEHQ